MPSKSPAQHRLMEAVAHSPKVAKKVGIPQKVGKDFATADKGVVAKRRANNSAKGRQGLKNRVTDSDPMQKDAGGHYP